MTENFAPKYKCYDLGQQSRGTVVEVVLSCINNVRLMDNDNFTLYADSKNCKFFGGRVEKSPTRLTIPKTGHWHIVVDKAGFQALANSNVRAIPPKTMAVKNPAPQPANAAGAPAQMVASQSA